MRLFGFSRLALPLGQMLVNIFRDDDPHVDHRPDSDGDPG